MEQLKNMTAALTDMLYDPKTKGSVQKMLSDGPPDVTVPGTVNTVFKRFEDMMGQKNGPMPLDLKLPVGVSLFKEVLELGVGMGVLPQGMNIESSGDLLKATMEQYIKAGLKDKSIDPIELQQQVEPLMTDNDKQIGNRMGRESGVPGELAPAQVNAGMLQKAQAPMQAENMSLKKQNQQMQGALQGMAEMPQGEEA